MMLECGAVVDVIFEDRHGFFELWRPLIVGL